MKSLPFSRSLLSLRMAPAALFSTMALVMAQPASAVMLDFGNFAGGSDAGDGQAAKVISGDGNVVVVGKSGGQLFIWSADKGSTTISPVNEVTSVSSDGKFTVGTGANNHAFVWSLADGFTDLGTLNTSSSDARGVSDDGTVVVGNTDTSSSSFRAYLWTKADGMKALDLLPGGLRNTAYGVSGGQVVVGSNGDSTLKAVRWDGASGTVAELGTLGGLSEAYATNRDGSVVVGWSSNLSNLHAFRWTAAGGMQDIDKKVGNDSFANDVNADGSVVVGKSGNIAFRWTDATGMNSLGLLSGTTNSSATGVTDDGETVVGYSGNRPFIWNASFVEPTSGVLQDLSYLQTSLIRSADTVNHLVSTQTRRLRDLAQQQCQPGSNQTYCLGGGSQSYVGGTDSSDTQRDLQLVGGLRVSEQLTAGATLSIGGSELKHQDAEQKKAFGLGLWSAYQQNSDNTGWGGSASVALGNSDNSFERGVGLTDVQRARDKLKINSTALRVAASYGVQVGSSLVTPEVALTHTRTGQDGFTEQNAALPLTVDSSNSIQSYATISVRSATPVNAKGTLQLSLAVDALLKDETPAIEGRSQVPGLSEFKLDGSANKRRVVPVAMVGYSHALNANSTIGGGVQVSGASYQGDNAVFGVGVKYSYAF